MMATIVTIDSNVIVASRGYETAEPELVHEHMTFCLDGSKPLVNPPPKPPPPPSSSDQPIRYQPQRGSFLAMRKAGIDRSRTDTTSGSSESGAISSPALSGGGELTSPVNTLAKTPLKHSYSPNNNNNNECDSQAPQLTSSNTSLQDLYIDNSGDGRGEPEQNYEEETDYYMEQQTPPNATDAPPQDMTTAVALTSPLLGGASPLTGTPPDSLYAQANLPTNGSANQGTTLRCHSTEGAGERAGKGAQTGTKSNENHLGLSISPVGPGFFGSITPPPGSHQPVLYSAIGSLENCSAHSLKNRWKNKQQQPNAFVPKFDASSLIAPPRQQQNQRQHSADVAYPSLGRDVLSSQPKPTPDTISKANGRVQSTPDKFGDSTSTVKKVSPTLGGLPAPPQPPPPTKQYQSAFEASFAKVRQKVDAAQNRSQRHKKKTPPLPATANPEEAKPRSSMRKGRSSQTADGSSKKPQKSVKIDNASLQRKKRGGKALKKKPMELFRPSCDAYTPRMERKKITYKPAQERTPVQKMATTMGTLSRPNFRDALRRVAMLIRQHIVKIEQRFAHTRANDEGLFKMSMKEAFSEEKFATCRYKCTVVRVPMARPGMVFGLKKIRPKYEIPTEEEIYEFAHQLFKTVQLSSECSIVCLIYIERLMERSKVPLLASTWRPIFMCGLLLASKVWQDLSSWNIEFASVYPQFSLDAINKLELQFLRMVKWDLYISSSLYAKYYFALRSIVEKQDFRQRYNRMVGGVDSVAASEALKIQKRTEQVKEEALMQLSRSM